VNKEKESEFNKFISKLLKVFGTKQLQENQTKSTGK